MEQLSTMENYFREWLDDKLEDKGWTRAEFCRRAGLNDATISAVYNGRRGVGPETINTIAEFFDTPLDEMYQIFGIREVKNIDDARIQLIDMKVRELSIEDQDELLKFIEFLQSRDDPPVTYQTKQQRKSRQGSNPGELVK